MQAKAAAAWSRWEGDTLIDPRPEARPAKFNEQDFATAFARIECHYFQNGGFFPHDGWLVDQADKFRPYPRLDHPGPLRRGHLDGRRLAAEEGLASRPASK